MKKNMLATQAPKPTMPMPEPAVPVDMTCVNKECGSVCSPPCEEGLMCMTVMKYCQPDGSCGMNSKPMCPAKVARLTKAAVCCFGLTSNCLACAAGMTEHQYCKE